MSDRRSPPLRIADYILIGGLLMTFGANQWQLKSLQERYDREVVPRAEHLQMNAVIDERWRDVKDQLIQTNEALRDIKTVQSQIQGQLADGFKKR